MLINCSATTLQALKGQPCPTSSVHHLSTCVHQHITAATSTHTTYMYMAYMGRRDALTVALSILKQPYSMELNY